MKNNFITLILAVFVLIAGSGLGSAADIIVHNGESIQAAVDNATSGDHIIVQPGTYGGEIDLSGKEITLSGKGMPIITGSFIADEGINPTNIAINGFTFKNNPGYSCFVAYASCSIKNCKFINCNPGIIAYDMSGIYATNNQFINCETGIASLPFSYIYAHNNKFIDCGVAIDEPAHDATVDAKDNIIIHSGKTTTPVSNPTPTPKPVSNPTPKPNPVTETITTSPQQSITPIVPSGTNVQPEENITVNCKNDDGTMYEVPVVIEELKDKLDSMSSLPEGEIYKLFNIYFGTDVDSITNATVNFSVNNSWIQDNDINQSSIALDEYNNKSEEWDKLPTNITGNDDQEVYCTTNVSSIANNSSFAITANQTNAATAA